jgi:hypothetical protein
MIDLALINGAIAAATSAVGLFDKISDEIERFVTKRPEPAVPKEHRQQIQKEGDAIVSRMHGQVYQTITAKDLEKLPESDLRHIRVLEQSMENHYSVWASAYPQLALAVDPIAKARTEIQLKGIVSGMNDDLNGILGFLEESGLHLDDHYQNVRNVVNRLSAAA